MIVALSTHEQLIAQVRRAARDAARPCAVVASPRELAGLGSSSLLVVDTATAVCHAEAESHVLAFLTEHPNARLVVCMRLENPNAELMFMLELTGRLAERAPFVMAPEQVHDTTTWDDLVGDVEVKRTKLRNEARTALLTALMKVSTERGVPFDPVGARVLSTLMDEVPDVSNVKEYCTRNQADGSVNQHRLRQHRAWRSVFGEARLPTNLAIVLFKVLWYKYLTQEKGYTRSAALTFLHLQQPAFGVQVKRRCGIPLARLEVLTTDDVAEWVASVCLTDFNGRSVSGSDCWSLAPARVRVGTIAAVVLGLVTSAAPLVLASLHVATVWRV